MELLLLVALADRSGQLADLLGEPSDRGSRPASVVAVAIDFEHQLLKLLQFHVQTAITMQREFDREEPQLTE
jgi:hypothetical protein